MRGEGNHKIPGSFAPENMEKTGAERVKYSLACQHEDAISIKFVSYAQKCPTVLCTFASLSARRAWIEMTCGGGRNEQLRSLSARRAWIEISTMRTRIVIGCVALRKESVDRNKYVVQCRKTLGVVALRKESVDRNILLAAPCRILRMVALRKESVDRNGIAVLPSA